MKKNICAAAVDIGGTKIEICLVDEKGKVLSRVHMPTLVKEGYSHIELQIKEAIEALEKDANHSIIGIGIGMAGQIESESGVIKFAPNLKWHNAPLKEDLSDHLGLPVHIINDVRAAALGEYFFGAGRGSDNILCVFVGTGIGSAHIINGRIYSGNSNSAGEIGHTPIDFKGDHCTCGNIGCIETVAAGWGISRRAQKAVQDDPKGGQKMLELVGGHLDKVDGRVVCAAADQWDDLALQLLDETTEALISGAIGWVNAYNPQRLILGGGVINGYPHFIQKISKGVHSRALKAATHHLEVVQAELHGDAGVIGAAMLAFQHHNQSAIA